ncbi:MAG TPA: O-antigen ligase family protein [Bryobacteraceae bacterium]|nr:O-antigen ligase family protein [Bryobacteraceae bacterium]
MMLLPAAPIAWLSLFFAVALLAPPLPIALGNSGPHPSVVIAAFGALLGWLRFERWRFERTFLNGSIVVFFSILLISLAPAAIYSGVDLAAESLVRVALAAIAAYVFFYVSQGPGRTRSLSLNLIFGFAIAAAMFAILDFYFQFPAPAGFGPQFIWLDSGVFRRAQGLFYEASTLGNFCVFFLAMIAVGIARKIFAAKAARVFALAGAAILLTALILSYSRSCLVALAVALLALWWLERGNLRLARAAILAAIFTAVVIGALLWFFPAYADLYWTRLTGSLDLALNSNARLLSGRFESWQTLLGFLASHPWHLLLGVGYKTLPYSDFTGAPIVADNMYLSMLVETGVFGLLALIALNFAILRAGYLAARSEDTDRRFFGAWIFCFWMAQSVQMLSADLLTFWRVLPLYFWALAMAVRR